jgi:hypothetical protein
MADEVIELKELSVNQSTREDLMVNLMFDPKKKILGGKR